MLTMPLSLSFSREVVLFLNCVKEPKLTRCLRKYKRSRRPAAKLGGRHLAAEAKKKPGCWEATVTARGPGRRVRLNHCLWFLSKSATVAYESCLVVTWRDLLSWCSISSRVVLVMCSLLTERLRLGMEGRLEFLHDVQT